MRTKKLQSRQNVTALAVDTSPVDVFVLNVEGRDWLCFTLAPTGGVGAKDINACSVYGYHDPADGSAIATLASVSGDFSTPNKPVEWAKGDPTSITGGSTATALIRVTGFSQVIVSVTATGTWTLDASACVE